MEEGFMEHHWRAFSLTSADLHMEELDTHNFEWTCFGGIVKGVWVATELQEELTDICPIF
jgi:hypothetical protein